MSAAPERHLHATLDTPCARAEVAAAFEAAGWRVRPCGQAEWRLERADADLVLEAASPMLLHGPLGGDSEALAGVLAAVAPLPGRIAYEVYDETDALVASG